MRWPNIKNAKILLSGYNCDLYNNLLNFGYTREDFDINTQNTKRESKIKVESLWKNY